MARWCGERGRVLVRLAWSAVVIQEAVRIPKGVRSLRSFRKWARSEEFPERGWFSYLKGELWVDLTMEQLLHNKIKGAYGRDLDSLVTGARLGHYFHDRIMLVHIVVGLATEPDGMF